MNISPVKDYFRTGKATRPPLVTTLFDHAAALNGIEPAELIADPARLTRALLDMHRLLQTDVVTVKFGSVIHIASGAEPEDATVARKPLPFVPEPGLVLSAAESLLDTTRRLSAELKRNLPVLACIPGPVALTAGLSDDEAAKVTAVLRGLIEAACKAGASLILFEEADGVAANPAFARLAAPTVNTARYYTASVIVSDDPGVPKALADGLLVNAAVLPRIGKGQRRGMRIDLDQIDNVEAVLAQHGSATDAIFMSVDDAALSGRPIEAIDAAFERLRTLSFR